MAIVKKNAFEDDHDKKLSAIEFAELGGRKLVYIRAIPAEDVMDDLGDELDAEEIEFEEGAIVYSVHASDGERIALVGDRDVAFAAAKQYEMNPVSVH